ncbi:MAG: hypothetical protein FGF53_08580 [Candidatus Brockarchaeota archaeon]|nr:hypothetical protein [Candidatus Brockarchaeota archaeon]
MRPSGFLALTLILIGLCLFSLFAPITQETRITPIITEYQTETPYTNTSTMKAVSTTTVTRTVDTIFDSSFDSLGAADIEFVEFEKTGDMLKTYFKFSHDVDSSYFVYDIAIDLDGDDFPEYMVIFAYGEECWLAEYRGRRSEISVYAQYRVERDAWTCYVPLSAIRGVTSFHAWVDEWVLRGSEPILLNQAPDPGEPGAKINVYDVSTRAVALSSQTIPTATSTYTTSSTCNSTYTVNTPFKHRFTIAPILFTAAVATAVPLAPLVLAKPKAEVKPSEEVEFCLMRGAELKADAEFCDECGAKQK